MSGSMKWIKEAVEKQRCGHCGAAFTAYATKELRFRLIPRPRAFLKLGVKPGYSALMPYAFVPCPNCKSGNEFAAGDVNHADMKKAIGWLIDRIYKPDDPFTGQPHPELIAGQEGDPAKHLPDADDDVSRDLADDDDDEPPASAPGSAPGSNSGGGVTSGNPAPSPASPSPKRPHAGRRLTQPSVRRICPPSPITEAVVAEAKRILRIYSFRRDAPSFPKLMIRFGVDLDQLDKPPEDGR